MDNAAPALQQFLTEFKRVSNAIVDSYFIVDTERRIVDFNRAFYALLPRSVARGLKGKQCYEVLELNICANECIAQQCWADNRHVRLDEISGNIAGEAQKLRFILSAVPITDEAGNQVGALEIQRNVTDEAVCRSNIKRCSRRKPASASAWPIRSACARRSCSRPTSSYSRPKRSCSPTRRV
jgi:PAS domain-containing protein